MNLRKIDALMAERVLGLTVRVGPDYDLEWEYRGFFGWEEVKPYSTDISAAWEVVEKLNCDIVDFLLCQSETPVSTGWYCRFGGESYSADSGNPLIGAPTAPLAMLLSCPSGSWCGGQRICLVTRN